MKSTEYKYRNDVHFHNLVNTIYNFYATGQFTPSELREACIFAATKYEMDRHTHKMWENEYLQEPYEEDYDEVGIIRDCIGGNEWVNYCPECKTSGVMEVVRPGKIQCRNCG